MPDTKARMSEKSCAQPNTNQSANIQELLNSLGAPPIEVCLDWAAQLLSLEADSKDLLNDSNPSTVPQEKSCSATDLGPDLQSIWSQWSLTVDGELRFGTVHASPIQACEQIVADRGSFSSVPEAASQQIYDPKLIAIQIAQLLDWAGADWDVGADHLCPTVQRKIVKRMARKYQNNRQNTVTQAGFDKVGPSSLPNESSRSNAVPPQMTSLSSQFQARAGGDKQRVTGAKRTARSKRTRDVSSEKRKWKPSRVWHFVVGLALPCLIFGFIFFLRQPADVDSSSSTALTTEEELDSLRILESENEEVPSGNASDARKAQASKADEQVGLAPDQLLTVEQLVEGSELQEIEDTLAALPDSTPKTVDSVVNSLREQLNSPNRPSTVSRGDTSSSGDPTAVDQEASMENPMESSKTTSSIPSDAERDSQELLENVVSELSRGNATEVPIVTELPVDSETTENKSIPAQLISTSALMQVQKFPNSFRAKEPSWEVILKPSEQFSIEPAEPQKLQGKTITSWTLLPVETKQRKSDELVRVLVQAQLAGRRPDIRWKITAGAKELPWLVVPLNSERLELMLAQVMELQARTTAAIEMLKLGGSAGGSRSAGPSPFRHRKSLEDHYKLLQRIERVLVDTSLYVTWLGESIEVHGQLTDTISSNQPVTVLQLGDGIVAGGNQQSPHK